MPATQATKDEARVYSPTASAQGAMHQVRGPSARGVDFRCLSGSLGAWHASLAEVAVVVAPTFGE